ncbi:MAG: hypothetical protein D6693_04320 [Planctomycetota bacterium]|nr:MAG: hypothetical protein D6693_04320 [Planctomycetota bacterium]
MARRARQRKRLLILLGAVAMLVVAGLIAVQVRARVDARRVAEARAAGLAASAEGRHAEALRHLSFVVAKDRTDGEAALALATSRRQVPEVNGRHLLSALAFARVAAEDLPGDPRPLRLIMTLASELGRLTERLDAARAVLAIDPADTEAMLVEVDSLARLGRRDEALDRAHAMRRAHPGDPDAVGAVVDLMLQTGAPEADVLAVLDQAVAQSPADARLALIRVRVLGQLNRLDEARQAALALAGLPVDSAQTLGAVVQLLDLLGESDAADRLLAESAATLDAADAAVVAAVRDWKNARFDAAIRRLSDAVSDPAAVNDDALGWTAVVCDRAEPGPAARAELESRQTDRALAWAATLAARDAVRAGDWVTASASARRALELDRANPVAAFLLGEAERGAGDWRAAVTRWRDLALREPRWLTLRLDLASALLAADQIQDAFDEAVQTLRQWPRSLVAALAAGRAGVALIEAGVADEARRRQVADLVAALVDQAGDDPASIALDARLRAASGDRAGARAALARLLDGDRLPAPEDLVPLIHACRRAEVFGVDELVSRAGADGGPETLLASALALHDAGRTAEAARLIDDAMSRAAGDPARAAAVERVRAVFLDRTGDPGAREALAGLVRDHPTDAGAILAVLDSRAAWSNRDLIESSILSLRTLVGEASSLWRVFEARARLAFDGDDEAAAGVVSTLEPVIRREPTNAAALALLAEAYATLRDYQRASEMMERAVAAQPPRFDLLARSIELLQVAGERDRARARLNEAMALEGLTPDQRRRRAALLVRQGAAAEALPDARAVAQATGSITDAATVAQVAQRAGAVDEARDVFLAILDRPDRTASAVLAAADFLALHDSVDAGLEALARLPEDVPPDDRAVVIADFEARHGLADAAARRLDEIARRTGRADAWLSLARVRAEAGDRAGALQAVTAGLEAHPNDADLLTMRDQLTLEGGLDTAAGLRAALARMEEDHPNRRALEDYAAALEAAEARPDDAGYAVEQLRRVTEQHPLFFPPWRRLAVTLSQQGRPDEAATVAREAAARIAGSAEAARLAAEALAIAGRFDEALAMARQWRERLSSDPYPAVLFESALLRRLDREAEALSLLEGWRSRVLAEADDQPNVLLALAELLVKAGRPDEAADLIAPLAQQSDDWKVRRLGLASDLIAQPARAREWIERWQADTPDSAAGWYVRGKAWYDLGTALGDRSLLERALGPLERAAGSDEFAAGASLMLAASYEVLGRDADAQRAYRAVLQRAPDEPGALNNLAYLLVRTGGDATEAVRLARRAVAITEARNPGDAKLASYLDTLGAALAAAGDPAGAADAYARAATITPDAPGVLLGLAEARLAAGQPPGDALDRLRALRDRGRITSAEERQRLADILERAGGG